MSDKDLIDTLPKSRKINGKFQNTIETHMDMSPSKMFSVMWRMLRGSQDRTPKKIFPTAEFNKTAFENGEYTKFSWFGHSSLLVRFGGKNILFDPVFSPRASMFSFAGPKNFGYSHPMDVSKLPKIDIVMLSHDHYDHLDKAVIKAIHHLVPIFYAPLEVGKTLIEWGVPAEKIIETDWWDKIRIDENLEIICTPSRHFSGRGLTDRATTLWCSWVFIGSDSRFYFSGDSGYSPEFKTIGDLYGPFDFAFMECGQYNEDWEAIHMMPEQTAQAALDVKANVTIPIHWGKFALALHSWKDSAERFKRKAEELKLNYFFPEIMHDYEVDNITPKAPFWWETL